MPRRRGGTDTIRGSNAPVRERADGGNLEPRPHGDSDVGNEAMTRSGEHPRIAFQGELGAYSHAACREARPELDPLPCPTFEEAFEVVESGGASCAMIPIDNSLGGRVALVHTLLRDSSLHIVAEHFHRVRHCLLCLPGADPGALRRVRSHPHALLQCRGRIRELDLEAVESFDTAGAAREIVEEGDPAVAAIASRIAGETHGLDVVLEGFEDHANNVTRFVVMSREPVEIDPGAGPCITAYVFEVKSVPAALYKGLGGFATNGVNLSKIESYLDASFSVAEFYIEFEGHPDSPGARNAIEELGFFSSTLNWLGTWPVDPFRRGANGSRVIE